MEETIFYRLATKKEQLSPTAKNAGYNSMPDKPGYSKVFMPYGKEGSGFYYFKN